MAAEIDELALPEDLRELLRMRTREEAGCWLWIGYCANNGRTPIYVKGNARTSLRAVLWRELHPEDASRRLMVVAKCEQARCVNPAHAKALLPSQLVGWHAKRGAYSTPAMRAAGRRTGQAGSVLDLQKAREIRARRAEGVSYERIAEEVGASRTAVTLICKGKRFVEVLPGASVFHLGAGV